MIGPVGKTYCVGKRVGLAKQKQKHKNCATNNGNGIPGVCHNPGGKRPWVMG